KEALGSPDSEKWRSSMAEELDDLWKTGAFRQRKAPKGIVPIKTRFVFKVKRAADGSIERYKARLVAKGYVQRCGRDFFESFSPVVGFDTMRIVFAISAMERWNLKTLDFKQAYLNAKLSEETWLELPSGEVVQACKALYGLRQSALEWYRELKDSILEAGWESSKNDECLYTCRKNEGKIAVLVTYVDDVLLTGNDEDEIQKMVTYLLSKYEGRDLGMPEKFVAINIQATEEGITLNQSLYAEGIVFEGMGSTDVRRVSTPLDPGMDVSAKSEEEDELDISRFPYARVLGKLMFLGGITQPDISSSVRELSRHIASPCIRHWRALQHLLRYLAGTTNVGILYRYGRINGSKDGPPLVGYSDAD
ncbi:MAG: reverse transcriptase domain-containing protein, partial [Sphaerochaetaceae bacterium]